MPRPIPAACEQRPLPVYKQTNLPTLQSFSRDAMLFPVLLSDKLEKDVKNSIHIVVIPISLQRNIIQNQYVCFDCSFPMVGFMLGN